MKSKSITLATLLLTLLFLSFTDKNEIDNCFISYKGTSVLIASEPDGLSKTAEKFRILKTDSGEVKISRIDAFRVVYKNPINIQFVNIKVELSESDSYESDKIKLLNNLKYLNSHSKGMDSTNLRTIKINGFEIYGNSRNSIESGTTLGTYVMFPKKDIIVYFYFMNSEPLVRDFKNIEDFKKQRDKFMDDYTKHLLTCKDK